MGLREETIKEEDRIKKLGVMEPPESPWAVPVILVRKKDDMFHYCFDFHRLNEFTKENNYSLPNIQDCLESLDGPRFFLPNGFNLWILASEVDWGRQGQDIVLQCRQRPLEVYSHAFRPLQHPSHFWKVDGTGPGTASMADLPMLSWWQLEF